MSVTPIDLNGETSYVFDGNGTFLTQLTKRPTVKIGSKELDGFDPVIDIIISMGSV